MALLRLLDRAAVDSAGSWMFKPALEDGKPVKSQALVKVHFALR